MKFKEWLMSEGEYGSSAYGQVGEPDPNDYSYEKRGIRSATTATDPARRRFSGLKNFGLRPGSGAGYGVGQQPKRVAAGLL